MNRTGISAGSSKAALPEMKIMMPDKKSHMKRGFTDYLISVITYFVYSIFAFVCIYPFYYIIINSISDNQMVKKNQILFYPQGIHFKNYESILDDQTLFAAAKVSILRTVVGGILIVFVAAFLGYMFTRQTMWHRKLWYRFVTATMYINAGIIPWYMTMKLLGMTNSFWGYIFPMLVQPFYIVLCKTYCESVPPALQDAAEIDGAGTIRIFFSIMLPVIKPILATIALFAAVNHWNSLQDNLLLMTSDTAQRKLTTLQMKLWNDIKQAESNATASNANSSQAIASLAAAANGKTAQMTVTVIVVLPIMCVYPFLQRYFTKGIMIGAVKG